MFGQQTAKPKTAYVYSKPAMISLTASAAAASISSGGGGGGAGPRNSSWIIWEVGGQHISPTLKKALCDRNHEERTSETLATKIVLPPNCLPPIAFIAFLVPSISLYMT